MTPEERSRVFRLRCRSKSGHELSREEHRFLTKMYERHQVEYESMSREVFIATAPFGSKVNEEEQQ